MTARLGVMVLSLLAVVSCSIERNVSLDAQIELRAADVVPFEGALEMRGPTGEMLFVQPTPAIVTTDLLTVESMRNDWGKWTLGVTLTTEGAATMEQLTRDHVGKPIAFLIEGEIISAPVVTGVVSDKIVIDGHWDEDEVRELVQQLRSD